MIMFRQSITLRRVGHSLLACAGLTWLAGCSSKVNVPPKLVLAVGKVTLDDKPLTCASVIFVPRDHTKGTGGFGVTDAEGRYEVRHQSNEVGIESGTYNVVFSKIAMPDGSPIPDGKNAADVGAVEVLPPKLSNPPAELGINVVTVGADGGAFDFELRSK
jgi:hypothetical protein